MFTFVGSNNKKMIKIFIISLLCIVYTAGNIIAQSADNNEFTRILISTDSGNIRIVLYEETPLHRENFIKLIKEGYYDGQLFHRLIKNFMIQAGDPHSKVAKSGEVLGQGGPGYTIPAEIIPKYFHKKGALAAARKGDQANPTKASSGSQFYIVQGSVITKAQLDLMVESNKHRPFSEAEIAAYTKIGGSPHLDGGYTVFGEVEEGFEVLEKLMQVPVDSNNRPVTDISFSISILEYGNN